MLLVAGVIQTTPVIRIAWKSRQPLLGVDDFWNVAATSTAEGGAERVGSWRKYHLMMLRMSACPFQQ
jgi:hypothetical protein